MMNLPDYDAWKLRSPDWDDPPFECSACDDLGCPECCPLVPVTLDDLEDLQEQIDAAEGLVCRSCNSRKGNR
jgi:hypothetical protein